MEAVVSNAWSNMSGVIRRGTSNVTSRVGAAVRKADRIRSTSSASAGAKIERLVGAVVLRGRSGSSAPERTSDAPTHSSRGQPSEMPSLSASAKDEADAKDDSEQLLAIIAAAESAGHSTVASILRARVGRERQEKEEQTRLAAATSAGTGTGAGPDPYNDLLL